MSSSHHFHAHFPHLFHWTGHWPGTVAIGTVIVSVAVVATIAIRVTRPALANPVTTQAPGRSSSRPVAKPSPAASAANPQSGHAGQEQRSVRDIDFGDLRWVSLQGFEVPASAQAGPRAAVGGVAYGFADTAAGAVLAAANIVTRSSWECGPGVFGPTIEKQVSGADAMNLLENTVSVYDQDASQLPGLVYPRLAAYRLDGYTSGDALVSLVVGAAGSDSSMYSVTPVEVRWTDGDWRVVAPAGGTWPGSYVPSPSGYTAFPRERP